MLAVVSRGFQYAAFALLGRRFCPRTRGVRKKRLSRLDSDRDYGLLAGLALRIVRWDGGGRSDRRIE
ncbi:MAG: Tn3 family transposase [Singulisphaera sp.]|nr:Tn3 family transposase [Singulisphaera sp.]